MFVVFTDIILKTRILICRRLKRVILVTEVVVPKQITKPRLQYTPLSSSPSLSLSLPPLLSLRTLIEFPPDYPFSPLSSTILKETCFALLLMPKPLHCDSVVFVVGVVVVATVVLVWMSKTSTVLVTSRTPTYGFLPPGPLPSAFLILLALLLLHALLRRLAPLLQLVVLLPSSLVLMLVLSMLALLAVLLARWCLRRLTPFSAASSPARRLVATL